jgi:hypothetical protein
MARERQQISLRQARSTMKPRYTIVAVGSHGIEMLILTSSFQSRQLRR